MKKYAYALISAVIFMSSLLVSCRQSAPLPPASAGNCEHYVAQKDAAGTRTLYPVKGGKVDRQRPVRTVSAEWHTGNPPLSENNVYCFTYHNTPGNFCGVACTDNSWYPMGCAADIFNNGFDIVE
jgi:hypothetical protein